MLSLPTSSSPDIALGYGSLPWIALALLSAYAVLSTHYNCKVLKLKLSECQINSRLSEKEFTMTTKAMDAQNLALRDDNEKLHGLLLACEKRNGELACLVAQRDAAYLGSSLEVERMRSKEKKDMEASVRAIEAVSKSNEYQIQTLSQAKEELEAVHGQQEQKILELSDKLSECHRRLASGDPLNALSIRLTESSPDSKESRYPHQNLGFIYTYSVPT